MPIDYKKYPQNWKLLVARILDRAKNSCELCPAINGQRHWKTGSQVVLTIHHIDGNLKNNSDANLIALCQRCHLRLDRGRHIENRRRENGRA